MKLVATFLVAVFVVAGTSFAFGDCAGHNKAQMVKNQTNQTQEQLSKEQPTSTPLTVAEKAPEPAKSALTPDKK